ncbi:MAG: hypothetical protein JSS86_13595 [Cyanobacteria bacterium SZAS LIN-2]|nr:hypothetical protein [Cyanobacteria bacterium SZAS LIN-2]MBS2010340.1 hypothetical protein [Cyanobacteria bacterium SZAS TMP-1]
MQLKPQDILVLLKLIGLEEDWSYRSLAQDLFMSTGEVHNALDRATKAQLFDSEQRRPRLQALEEFLVHGIKYAFPAERGSLTRGTPTAYAAPPLNEVITAGEGEHPPVWPDPTGAARGYKLEPLYDSAPKAARKDKTLYELLALVDAIRDGRARERTLAAEYLHKRLKAKHAKA